MDEELALTVTAIASHVADNISSLKWTENSIGDAITTLGDLRFYIPQSLDDAAEIGVTNQDNSVSVGIPVPLLGDVLSALRTAMTALTRIDDALAFIDKLQDFRSGL